MIPEIAPTVRPSARDFPRRVARSRSITYVPFRDASRRAQTPDRSRTGRDRPMTLAQRVRRSTIRQGVGAGRAGQPRLDLPDGALPDRERQDRATPGRDAPADRPGPGHPDRSPPRPAPRRRSAPAGPRREPGPSPVRASRPSGSDRRATATPRARRPRPEVPRAARLAARRGRGPDRRGNRTASSPTTSPSRDGKSGDLENRGVV